MTKLVWYRTQVKYPNWIKQIFLIVCFTSYFVFSIAVLPHSPGVVYYHLLLREETRIPRAAPFSFRIGIWDLFVHRGQKSYTPTAFGKLWTTSGVWCIMSAWRGTLVGVNDSVSRDRVRDAWCSTSKWKIAHNFHGFWHLMIWVRLI